MEFVSNAKPSLFAYPAFLEPPKPEVKEKVSYTAPLCGMQFSQTCET